MKNQTTAAALAATAALLFGSTTLVPANAEEAKVKCEGVNKCKGKSQCATAHSACNGQNSCKGKGYLMLSKAECDTAKAEMQKTKS